MRKSRLVSRISASLLSIALLLPVQAQESGESLFRMDIKAPILFSGGNGDTSGETPPIETQNPLTIFLQGTSPFEVNVGEPMSAIDLRHFATVNGNPNVTNADLTWTASTPGDLPPGVTLSGSSLLGTPTTVNSYDFEVVASHPDAADAGRQVYTIIVNGVELKVTAISAGVRHTCAVTVSGGAKCWGENNYGQLGNGSTTNQLTPVDVQGLTSGVASISAGFSYTCAVTTSGGAKCWGQDNVGQLGDNAMLVNKLTPTDVDGLTAGVSSISAGDKHTCAVMISTGAKCWGEDIYGQLGDNSTLKNQPVPVNVQGLTTGVSSISAGVFHTCAITTGGKAKCWGQDTNGQLGDNATLENKPTPVDVFGLASGVASIGAGYGHSCALMASGGIKCWGSDTYGQLGNDAAFAYKATPVDVSELSNATSISVGRYYTCAVTNSGTARCWGDDRYSQLGNDAALENKPTPVNVLGLSAGVTSISAGGYHICAMTTSGDTKCWGWGELGQLGNNSTENQSTPSDTIMLQ